MPLFTAQKILFDLDGTLVDTAADLHAATNHTLLSIGRAPVSLDQVRHMTGYGALKLIELGLEATGGTRDLDMETLRHTFLAFYRANICDKSQVYSGGIEVLECLKSQGFQMAVCTNKPHAMAVPLLEEIGIAHYFDVITGGDSFPFKKPDARHIINTIRMLTGSGAALMVGDSSPDILGAQAANIPVVAVNFGYPDVPVETHGPDAIISSLTELPALLAFSAS